MIAARVIGHRGAAGVAPENTLAGVRAAAKLGVRWIEVDAQLSADGVAITFHDDTLERCTGGHGALADHDYAELAALDAGSGFDARFAGERIPTLADLLALCQTLCLGVNLELKVAAGRDAEALAAEALSVIAAQDIAPAAILISSFDRSALEACRCHDAQVQMGLLCEHYPDDMDALRKHLQLVSVHCDGQHLTQAHVQHALGLDLEVYAWTINQSRQAQKLWGWGVHGIITDYPQRFA